MSSIDLLASPPVKREGEREREINGINLFTQERGRLRRQTDDYKTDDAHGARSAQLQKIFDLSLPLLFSPLPLFLERARCPDLEMLVMGLVNNATISQLRPLLIADSDHCQ